MELKDIKGIGPKTIEKLESLDIFSLDDLVRYYPYRYKSYIPINILDAESDETVTITGTIISPVKLFRFKRNQVRYTFQFETNNVIINVTIFNGIYLTNVLKIGKRISLIGKYEKIKNSFKVSEVKTMPIDKPIKEPVYHLNSNIKRSVLRKAIDDGLKYIDNINEIVPDKYNIMYNLIPSKDAIKIIHNPKTNEDLKQSYIKLKYEELFEFMFKINVNALKNKLFNNYIIKDNLKVKDLDNLKSLLPFELTKDQNDALNDIFNDFKMPRKMNRLLLGDVGSGKTIIAFLACILNKKAGYQSAILAPTEVLATQHLDNFKSIFKDLDINVELLVGSKKQLEKKTIINKLKTGEIDILIGTHAILEDSVEFNNLGLVVTDEQHRFGVNQRKALQNKGDSVDVLYMSATPIPRTYALTIYGDMDISIIKTKPSGRKEIITTLHKFDELKEVGKQIEDEINKKHQVYVISPLIEDDEEEPSELNDLLEVKEKLESIFTKKHKIGILHGKMKPLEKDKTMNEFKDGKIDILISTTVIEVGVDVKNATCMTIFNAERFGLATLHQLRGRVGRNEFESKCLLVSDKETERLNVLCESNDGFYISERDFELRGSGDLFGVRQHGDMSFKIVNIYKDIKILEKCKNDTKEFIDENIENNFRDYPYYQNIISKLMDNN